jgi:hypothetical protein
VVSEPRTPDVAKEVVDDVMVRPDGANRDLRGDARRIHVPGPATDVNRGRRPSREVGRRRCGVRAAAAQRYATTTRDGARNPAGEARGRAAERRPRPRQARAWWRRDGLGAVACGRGEGAHEAEE